MMTSGTGSLMLLLILLGAASAAANSIAPSDSLWTMEEQVVHGDSLATVTVHGTRVQVVAPAEIDRLRQQAGANALSAAATIPGVSYRQAGLVSAGASGNPPWAFRMRGIGSVPNDGLLVLVDGRPQVVGFWGHALPDAHPLGPIERVEVIRGPASVPFGGQAFAGAIQVITRGGPSTMVQATGGDFGTWNVQGRHHDQHGPVTLTVGASAAATDGYRGGDESDLQALRLDLGTALGKGWLIRGAVDGTDSRFNNPGPESQRYADPDSGSGTIRQRTAELAIEGRGEVWASFVRAYSSDVHNDFYQAGNTQARDSGIRAGGEWTPTNWAFKGGLDLDNNGGTFTVNGNPNFPEVDQEQITTAPYLMAAWDPSPRWQIGGGLRMQFNDTFPTETIPQAKLAYLADSRGAITLSAAKGAKTPTVAQQYLVFFAGDRTQLEPEHMWQYELAVDRTWGPWFATAAVYRAEGDNLIRQPQPGWPPTYDNSGDFSHEGLDATVSWRPGPVDKIRLGAAWMWMRDDQTLATPGLHLRLDGVWEVRHGLELDAMVEAEWDRYGADGSQAPLDDLLLAGLGVTWRPTRLGSGDLEIFGRVDNLFDEQYMVFDDYPMPPRMLSAGIRWQR